MAKFTFRMNKPAFHTVWEYPHNNDIYFVGIYDDDRYWYRLDSEAELDSNKTNLTEAQLISALTTALGEAPEFPTSEKGESIG
jgi:hypothetical protein